MRAATSISGAHPLARVLDRGVEEVREAGADVVVRDGVIDIGKRLRPSYRRGRVVLFVEPNGDGWRALKLS